MNRWRISTEQTTVPGLGFASSAAGVAVWACLALATAWCPQAWAADRPLGPTTAPSGRSRPFEGLRALVVEPENSWTWDSAVFGALAERGFEVAYGAIPTDLAALRQFDLVALSIRRGLSAAEDRALRTYVAEGGAVYGSWGGPFGSPGFHRDVCRVGGFRSLRFQPRILGDIRFHRCVPLQGVL